MTVLLLNKQEPHTSVQAGDTRASDANGNSRNIWRNEKIEMKRKGRVQIVGIIPVTT